MFESLRQWWTGSKPKIEPAKLAPRPPRIFLFDSLFLKDCHAMLTAEKRQESLVYATGILSKGVAIPQKLIPLLLAERSGVHAKADPASSHQALVSLEETGHALLAVLHTHPWNGPAAAFGSAIDFATQEAYERQGYPCIGGVFTLDGYVRFFTKRKLPRIIVYGGGIENHGNGLYRIRS